MFSDFGAFLQFYTCYTCYCSWFLCFASFHYQLGISTTLQDFSGVVVLYLIFHVYH